MQSSITMLSAPRELRGRMMGLMSFCIGVGTPLGTLEIGAVAAAFSTPWAITVNAVAGLVLLLPALFFTPLVLAANGATGGGDSPGIVSVQGLRSHSVPLPSFPRKRESRK